MESYLKKITAVLGPTNTGKTHLAVKTMLEYESGIIGFPLRLLAREVFDKSDYNVSVGTQPHSEISALAVLLDRIQKGEQFDKKFYDPEREIIPSNNGKNVIMKK